MPEPNALELLLYIRGGKLAFLFKGGLYKMNPPLAALYILFYYI